MHQPGRGHRLPGALGRGGRTRARATASSCEWLAAELAALGFEVTPTQTNFLLVRCPGDAGDPGRRTCCSSGVIVRPMDAFGLGDGALRISVGLPAENRRCIEALKEILS